MRKLIDASTGWNAVAAGSAERPGLNLKAANEQDGHDGMGPSIRCTSRTASRFAIRA